MLLLGPRPAELPGFGKVPCAATRSHTCACGSMFELCPLCSSHDTYRDVWVDMWVDMCADKRMSSFRKALTMAYQPLHGTCLMHVYTHARTHVYAQGSKFVLYPLGNSHDASMLRGRSAEKGF